GADLVGAVRLASAEGPLRRHGRAGGQGEAAHGEARGPGGGAPAEVTRCSPGWGPDNFNSSFGFSPGVATSWLQRRPSAPSAVFPVQRAPSSPGGPLPLNAAAARVATSRRPRRGVTEEQRREHPSPLQPLHTMPHSPDAKGKAVTALAF